MPEMPESSWRQLDWESTYFWKADDALIKQGGGIMPGMEYIPKLKEVEGVEGGGPLTRLQYGKNTR